MLTKIQQDPKLKKYIRRFRAGDVIFMERDESQDIYILVSGEVGIFKGNRKISEITERNAIFGEMSSLLESKRTATVKASTDVEVVCIPTAEITKFLSQFPDVGREMSRRLAERLEEASQILYGLNELLDQLPDAVILTDRDGKILEWNRAAERLYGRGWDKMSHRSAEEIYEDPQAYREFLVEVQEKWEARERTLKARHPKKGILYVATSMTVLYDAHHNFQGVLSLGRDVTAAQNLEKRYRRIRTWLYPILAVLLFLAVGGIVSYPYLEKTYFTVAPEKKRLLDQLYEDYERFSLKLAPHFRKGDPTAVEIMKAYFQESSYIPYTGFVILDEDKTVLNAYSRRDDEKARRLIGSSYRGIQFKGDQDALQRVLSVFHIDKEHPMGRKSLEVAFEIMAQGKAKGWLIFQMDTDLLKEKGLDEEELREFDFENR